MKDWSLPTILSGLHKDIQNKLQLARESFGHPVSAGDASEEVWLELLTKYLPKRYMVAKAFVVDSKGIFSQQIDVLVFDRQYTPFIFEFNGEKIVPAEGVYAAFEAKQSINARQVGYAQEKLDRSVSSIALACQFPTLTERILQKSRDILSVVCSRSKAIGSPRWATH